MGKTVPQSILDNTKRLYSKEALARLSAPNQSKIKEAELQKLYHLISPDRADDVDLSLVYQSAGLVSGSQGAKFLSDELIKNLKSMINEHQTPDQPIILR